MFDKKGFRLPLAAGIGLIGLIFLKYWFPIVLPFFLGSLLALGAEPMVRLLHQSRKLPRWAASFAGVTVFFLLMLTALALVVSVLVRQLGQLSGLVAQLTDAVGRGLQALETWLLELSTRLPDSLENAATIGVQRLFSDSSNLLDQAVSRVPQVATGLLSALSQGAFVTFTAILSAYMISARLPKLKQFIQEKLPQFQPDRIRNSVKGLRHAMLGWLSAQGKLMGLTFLLLCGGFFLLKTGNVLLLAALVTLVDAFPILGTGTVLIPWALLTFLQGNGLQAMGLLIIYAVTFLTRTAMEPRLVGRQLGLDPLLTLASLYAGFHFWGVGGMLAAPILCVIVKEATAKT